MSPFISSQLNSPDSHNQGEKRQPCASLSELYITPDASRHMWVKTHGANVMKHITRVKAVFRRGNPQEQDSEMPDMLE